MTAEQYSNEVLELVNESKKLYKKMAELNKGNVLEERYILQHITLTKIHEKLTIKHREAF